MSYYEEKIPELINKLKTAITQCMDIISREINDDLTDDKLHNVLKAKRMATEDVKYYVKEVEDLEKIIKGEAIVEVVDKRSKRKQYIKS